MLDLREHEIDKAWAQHDPDRAKIPVHVYRALRIYKRTITGDAARISKACDDTKSLRALLDDFTRKGQVGRQRASQGRRYPWAVITWRERLRSSRPEPAAHPM
jgi:hypothetical protein